MATDNAVPVGGWDDQPDVKAAHAELSAIDVRFRQFAARDVSCLDSATFAELERQSAIFRYLRQPWPTFMGPRKVAELERVSLGLSRLIRSIPTRFFGNDPARIAEFYGIEEGFAQLILEPPTGIEGALTRGDLVHGDGGFQCVEFNMTSNLGGWETAFLAEIVMRIPPVARFLAENKIQVSYRNTFRLMLEHVLREGLAVLEGGAREYNVAIASREADRIVAHPEVLHMLDREYALARQAVEPGLSGTLTIASYREMREERGALYYRGRRLHSIVERHVDSTEGMVFRCFKTGGVRLYNGPISWILSDKRNLAVLSEGLDAGLLSGADEQLVRGHVPWARRIRPGETTWRGERAALPDLILARRDSLVMKKARSLGGKDVVIGRFSAPQEWSETLRQALAAGDWVVQEYIKSHPYLFQAGSYGCSPHDIVWGPFVFGSTYAGTILRVQPKSIDGIVNLTRGATEGILLEVEEPCC